MTIQPKEQEVKDRGRDKSLRFLPTRTRTGWERLKNVRETGDQGDTGVERSVYRARLN